MAGGGPFSVFQFQAATPVRLAPNAGPAIFNYDVTSDEHGPGSFRAVSEIHTDASGASFAWMRGMITFPSHF